MSEIFREVSTVNFVQMIQLSSHTKKEILASRNEIMLSLRRILQFLNHMPDGRVPRG